MALLLEDSDGNLELDCDSSNQGIFPALIIYLIQIVKIIFNKASSRFSIEPNPN